MLWQLVIDFFILFIFFLFGFVGDWSIWFSVVLICCRLLIFCLVKCFLIECSINQVKVINVSIVDRLIKKVSCRVSEKGCLDGLLCIWDFQYVVYVLYCLDQFCFVIVVYFSVELFYCDINCVSVVVKIYVLDLRGNQGVGKNFFLMVNEEFQ